MGRPDDGTDVTTFNNIEFMVSLKQPNQWPHGLTKPQLTKQMDDALGKYPGVDFNFSQNIQDNVEEAMSGVKGENSLKLFGDDIDVLVSKAGEIQNVMARVPGIEDLGVLQETGQPELLISIDRAASARYGLMAADVNAAVQAAVGGLAATQILQGDRRFDFVIRYRPEARANPDAIRNILLSTPDGGRVPLGQVAQIAMHEGAFMIYRENGQRYIPIKFSVRGRDLAGTMTDVQQRIATSVRIPGGIPLRMGRRVRQLEERAAPAGGSVAGKPVDYSGAAFHRVQFAARRGAGDVHAAVWADGRAILATDYGHAVQYFGGGGAGIRDWSVHAGRRGDAFRASGARKRSTASSSRRHRSGRAFGNASGADGVRGGWAGLAAGGGLQRDRRAGATAAGARGGGRDGDFAAGDSVFVAAFASWVMRPRRGASEMAAASEELS